MGPTPGVGLCAAQALQEGTSSPGRTSSCLIFNEIHIPGGRGSNTQVSQLVT